MFTFIEHKRYKKNFIENECICLVIIRVFSYLLQQHVSLFNHNFRNNWVYLSFIRKWIVYIIITGDPPFWRWVCIFPPAFCLLIDRDNNNKPVSRHWDISALTRGLETRKPSLLWQISTNKGFENQKTSLLGHISINKGFGNQKNWHKTKEVSTRLHLYLNLGKIAWTTTYIYF